MKKILHVLLTLVLVMSQLIVYSTAFSQNDSPTEVIKYTDVTHPPGAVSFEWLKPSDAPYSDTKYIILRSTDKGSYREIASIQDQTYYTDFIDESKYKSIKYKITAEFSKYNANTDTDEIQNRESTDIYARDVYMQIVKVESIGPVYIEWTPPELENYMGYKIYRAIKKNPTTGDFISQEIVTDPNPLPKHYHYYHDWGINPDDQEFIAYQIQTSDSSRRSDWFVFKDQTTDSEVDPVGPIIDSVPGATMDSSLVDDLMNYVGPFLFGVFGSGTNIETDIGDLNDGDILDIAAKMADAGYARSLDRLYDRLIDSRNGLPAGSRKSVEDFLRDGYSTGGIVPVTGEGSPLPRDFQEDWVQDAALKMIKWDLEDGDMSGPGYTEDAKESANYVIGLLQHINPVNMDNYQCQYNTGVLCVFENLIRIALTLASLIAVAFVVYGGYLYITSAGNQEGAQAGIKAVTNAAIGLVIILASWIIINTVLQVIGQGTI